MTKLALQLIEKNKRNKESFLDLGNCGLVNTIPVELTDCRWLESINLGDYYLDITQNRWIKSENMQEYNSFQGNELEILQTLPKLKALHIRYTQIKSIKSLNNLMGLEQLNISYNPIIDFHYLINLINLQYLDISDNLIKEISFIEKLNKLRLLNLNQNLIQNIEPLIPFLKNGLKIASDSTSHFPNCIYLKSNPIKNPPLDILRQGNEAIIQYFEALKTQGKDFIYEAKLTIVGEVEAGKTSLQKRIIDKTIPLPSREERTRGIEITQWIFTIKQNKKFVVNIWDFGGDDIYFPVHRFFLTANSVFALVGSTRNELHKFEYWIPTIFQFGGKSPIILVQNCFHGKKNTWKELSSFYWNRSYNLIRPIHSINLPKQNEGLKKLEDIIKKQISQLPHIGEEVPKSWLKVREVLSVMSLKQPYVSFEQFIHICQETDKENFNNKKIITTLARFFHDLGIILWYHNQEYLQEWVILQPKWLMNAVYKIIDDKFIQEQKGIIHEQDFLRLWSGPDYESKHSLLKQLLGIFKIAFPKKSKPKDFLLPARLALMQNDEILISANGNVCLEYDFDFMPRGIVNQMSADLSRLITDDEKVWNNAVIFEYHTSKAKVKEDILNRKIFIKANGKDARGLIILITQSIDDIIESYPGVTPKKWVPCNCHLCKKNITPFLFDYNFLNKINTKIRDVKCDRSNTKISIQNLLYMEKIDKPNEIFISYSWGDKYETTSESREKIVGDLYHSLKKEGYTVIRDKEDILYKGLFNDFMRRLGRGNIVIIAISDKYLKSTNCMYELFEIYRNSGLERDKFIDKIFPIKIESLQLNKPGILSEYFDHWANEEKEWENFVDKHGKKMGVDQSIEYNKIKAITANLGDLLSIIKNINMLSKELLSSNDFKEIKDAINKQINSY